MIDPRLQVVEEGKLSLDIVSVNFLRASIDSFPKKFSPSSCEIGIAIELIDSKPSAYSFIRYGGSPRVAEVSREYGFSSYSFYSSDRADFLSALNKPSVIVCTDTWDLVEQDQLVSRRNQMSPLFSDNPYVLDKKERYFGGMEVISQSRDSRFHSLSHSIKKEDPGEETSGFGMGGICLKPSGDYEILRQSLEFLPEAIDYDFIVRVPKIIESILNDSRCQFTDVLIESDDTVILKSCYSEFQKYKEYQVHLPQLSLGYQPTCSLLSVLRIAKYERTKKDKGLAWLHIQSMGRIELVYIK